MADDPETNGDKKDTRIKPGEVRNPAGRPKGARNKLGEAFVKALHEDFEIHGVEAVEKVRDEKPDQYLKVIASLMPKEIDVGENFASALKESRDAAVAAALRADG
jgi:hypothetical protein